MIIPQELRIGNLVRLRNSEIDIEACVNGVWNDTARGRSSVHLEGNGIINTIDQIEGVPLTEEWLEKFGFEKNVTPVTDFFNIALPGIGDKTMKVTIEFGNQYASVADKGDLVILRNSDFHGQFMVHELQNLYFVLTGEELTIKVEEE